MFSLLWMFHPALALYRYYRDPVVTSHSIPLLYSYQHTPAERATLVKLLMGLCVVTLQHLFRTIFPSLTPLPLSRTPGLDTGSIPSFLCSIMSILLPTTQPSFSASSACFA